MSKRARARTEPFVLVVENAPGDRWLWVAPVGALDELALGSALAMSGMDASDDVPYERWRAECFDGDGEPRAPWQQWCEEQVCEPPAGVVFKHVVICGSAE